MRRSAARPGHVTGSAHDGGIVAGAGAILVAAGGVGMWAPVALTHPRGYAGGGPPTTVVGLVTGDVEWSTACTIVATAELVVLAGLVVAGTVLWRRWRRGRSRVDHAARAMGGQGDMAEYTGSTAEEKARRLRPEFGDGPLSPEQIGIVVGELLRGGGAVYQSWEDIAVHVWGMRTGKSTSLAIPGVLANEYGPTLVTSNKPDVHDATREHCAARGDVWVFDIQGRAGQEQKFWWNPLRHINTVTDARLLAANFASAEREPGDKRDSYFDPEGQELVALLILAAAASGRHSLHDVFTWTTQPRSEEAARILDGAGFVAAAARCRGWANMTEKTRSNIFGSAAKTLAVLAEPEFTKWITPSCPLLPEFDPAGFVHSRDTLFLISHGGPGSPAPIIGALTDAVFRTCEKYAPRGSGRRLPNPMLAMLDECANIVRIGRLPGMLSYLGSMGVVVAAVFQNYAQLTAIWGEKGAQQIWEAANIRTYGGGNADTKFLEGISRLTGEHDVLVRSSTTTRDGRSVSVQPQRRRILEVSDLAALPRGRMVIVPSGAPAVLARTCPWQHGPYAAAVRKSLARWDQAGNFGTQLDPDPDDAMIITSMHATAPPEDGGA